MKTSIGMLSALMMTGLVACAGGTVVVGPGTGPADPVAGEDEAAAPDGPQEDPSVAGDPTDRNAPAPPLVRGLAITNVAVFQAVKIDIVKEGLAITSDRNAPVVAGRPGLVRVYVTPSAGWQSRPVTAQLRLVSGKTRLPILEDTKTIDSKSTDDDPTSVFDFDVPATSLPLGVTYQIFLTDPAGQPPSGDDDARFPRAGGVEPLGAEASARLKIVVVPVKYDADGSGRLPDVSTAQLERYRKSFMALYPATDVEVKARAPFAWASTISRSGNGFSAILNAITNLRRDDKAAPDVYYYGAFAPAPSFGSFCGGGCVSGLSALVDSPRTPFLRASVGLGYTGQGSVETATHEVGHAHGRSHAPCGGAQGVDPAYPYAGGGIGVWGYDILEKTFISPAKGKDLMGYCPNRWVSDYTYAALFERIVAASGVTARAATGSSTGPGGGSRTFRTATLDADGTLAWGGDVDLEEEPSGGESRLATFVSASGRTIDTATARFYPYDHLPGGVFVVPPGPRDSRVAIQGARHPISTAQRP